jgi:hypothetical protein
LTDRAADVALKWFGFDDEPAADAVETPNAASLRT